MLAILSASIFTSKSSHYSLIGHGILLYNFHKYCMIYRLSMFEKFKNIMRDTVCRRFLHHIVLSYYIWDNVCRTFMRHIVVSYYIKATDVKKNGNPFCSKLLHFANRCQCSCKAKSSNYYILQRYYILGCDSAQIRALCGMIYLFEYTIFHRDKTIRQIKMPVEQLVASMIDLKSAPVHSTP